jgi:hypothetical protein
MRWVKLLDQHDTHTRSISSMDMIFVGVGLDGVKLSQFPSKMICSASLHIPGRINKT